MADETFPMIAPDGTTGHIPASAVAAAVKDGFKLGARLVAPDGSSGTVPIDKVHEAIGAGFTLTGAAPTPPAAPAEMQKYDTLDNETTNPAPGLGGTPMTARQAAKFHDQVVGMPAGAAKAAATTIKNAGRAAQWIINKTTPLATDEARAQVSKVPGFNAKGELDVMPHGDPEILKPAPNEKLGYGAEQVGEFFLPGGITSKLGKGLEAASMARNGVQAAEKLPFLSKTLLAMGKGGLEAASAGGVEALHGGDAGDVAKTAGIAAAGPLAIEPAMKGMQSLKDGLWGIVRPGSQTESAIFKGLKPSVKFTKSSFNDAVDRAVPEVLNAEKQTGTPVIDTQTLLDNVKQAKKNVYAKVDNLLQQADGSGATVDGSQATAKAQDALDAFNAPVTKAQIKQVQGLKKFYGGQASLQETEDRLQTLNAQLDSFYSQSGVSQAKALKSDPVMAAKAALADNLRSQVDEILTNVTGTGSAQLKQTYGSLRKLEDVTARRIPVAERASPFGMPSQIAAPHGFGRAVKGALNAQPLETVSGLGEMLSGGYLQRQNDSNELIRQAFASLRGGPKAPPVNFNGAGGLIGRTLAGSLVSSVKDEE